MGMKNLALGLQQGLKPDIEEKQRRKRAEYDINLELKKLAKLAEMDFKVKQMEERRKFTQDFERVKTLLMSQGVEREEAQKIAGMKGLGMEKEMGYEPPLGERGQREFDVKMGTEESRGTYWDAMGKRALKEAEGKPSTSEGIRLGELQRKTAEDEYNRTMDAIKKAENMAQLFSEKTVKYSDGTEEENPYYDPKKAKEYEEYTIKLRQSIDKTYPGVSMYGDVKVPFDEEQFGQWKGEMYDRPGFLGLGKRTPEQEEYLQGFNKTVEDLMRTKGLTREEAEKRVYEALRNQ